MTIIVNGINSKKERTFESKRLLNIIFRETALLSLFDRKNSLAKGNVWLGKLPVIDLIAKRTFKEIVSPFEFNKTKIKLKWNHPIPAPIKKGDKVIISGPYGEFFIKDNSFFRKCRKIISFFTS